MRPSHDFFVGLFYGIVFSLLLLGLCWYVFGLKVTLIVWLVGSVITIGLMLWTLRKP